MIIFKKFFFSTFILLLSFSASANDTIVVDEVKQRLLIGNYISSFEDPTDKLTLNDIIRKNEFKKSSNNIVNLGTTKSTYWLHFTCKSNYVNKKLLLEIQNSTIDLTEIYILESNGKLANTYKVHEDLAYKDRPYPDKNIIFMISDDKDLLPKDVYIKIKSTKQLLLPIFLTSSRLINENQSDYSLIFGIYIGIIFVMFFYNLFIYFSIKDSSYLYYVVYILFVGLTQAALKGYIFQYIFPNMPWLAGRSILIFSSLTGIFAILFLRKFIHKIIYSFS